MYCRECLEREVCTAPCPALEKHLHKIERYEREIIFNPRALELLADRMLFTWVDLFPDHEYLWDRLAAVLMVLPPELLHTFMLRYYEGLSMAELCRRQNLHKTTVRRRLRDALALVAAELGPVPPAPEIGRPAVDSPESA